MRTPLPPPVWWTALAVVAVLALAGPSRRSHGPALPEGTILIAALEHAVTTADARPGDTVELRTVHSVHLPDGGQVQAGALITGEVVQARSGRGRVPPDLLLRFTTLDVAGDHYDISSATLHVRARRVRATAGGGRGGVALGSGSAVASDGRELFLPAGRRITVRLTAPAVLRHSAAGDSRQVD